MRPWLIAPVHISWRIAAFSAGYLFGVLLALWSPPLFADYSWLVLAAGLLAGVVLRQYRWLVALALAAGLLVGLWRGTSVQQRLLVYDHYYGKVWQVRGVLRDDVAINAKGEQHFELYSVSIRDGSGLPGGIWISTAQPVAIKRGDWVTVRGQMMPGFGVVPASMSRAAIVTVHRPHPGDIARVFRDWFADGIRRGIAEPEASLGIGYLTGQRSSLPADLDGQLRVVGLTHAVVASGYNLTILVSFARNLLLPVSKYLATVSAGSMVICFMLITGFSPSMTRAGLVSGLSLLTWYYGRTAHPIVLLFFAAALTVGIHPEYIWGDLGWCLSFGAFVGVVLVAPLIRCYFWGNAEEPPMLAALIIETVSAQLTTLPIILYAFGQFASYALPANLLVLPLVPLTMALTFLTGVASLLFPMLAPYAGWPAHAVLHYMVWIIGHIAGLPGAQREMHMGWPGVLSSYMILSLLSIILWRRTGIDFRGSPEQKR